MVVKEAKVPIDWYSMRLRCPACGTKLEEASPDLLSALQAWASGAVPTLKCHKASCSLFGTHYKWPTVTLEIDHED